MNIVWQLDVYEPFTSVEDPETGELTLLGGISKRFYFGTKDEAVIAFAKAAKGGLDPVWPKAVRSRRKVRV